MKAEVKLVIEKSERVTDDLIIRLIKDDLSGCCKIIKISVTEIKEDEKK